MNIRRNSVGPEGCNSDSARRHGAAFAASSDDSHGEVNVNRALPLSNPPAPSTQPPAPPAPSLRAPRPADSGVGLRGQASGAPLGGSSFARPFATPLKPASAPPPLPRSTPERMQIARERIRSAAEAGQRIRSYEVALDLDLSEFHFARQFRAAFGRSPHVFYDEVRAERARALLRDGMAEGDVARKVGFRRPAELRALLAKRAEVA